MKGEVRFLQLLISAAVGLGIWFLPPPEGLSGDAVHLAAIFVATIFGIVLKAMPMGSLTLLALAAALLTKTLDFQTAFSGFSHSVVWLIVLAFFVARGFTKTGLGMRMGYSIVALLGNRTIGLGYGLTLCELLLAPAIPSMTARAGGVVFPIVASLSRSFDSDPNQGTARRIGGYLTQVAIQANLVTSAMFLTAASPNPLIASLAAEYGINITWTTWAVAALVPGLINLLILPWFLMRIYPPEVRQTPNASNMARQKLKEMGPISYGEWVMTGTFLLLIVLWVFGAQIGLSATTAALIGLCILLIAGVLTWNDLITEKGAWETLVWFSVLITLASELSRLGFTAWLGSSIVPLVQGFNWPVAFLILALAYFYSHYFFASALAHVAAMYGAFLAGAIVLGAPPLLAALVLAFFSSLFGGITHYGCGPSAVLFASRYVPVGDWWRTGFFTSLLSVTTWLIFGTAWWYAIGLI